MEKLKVALASDWYFPKVGGIEYHIHELALNLMRLGHEPHVLTHDYRHHTPPPRDNVPYPVHRLRGLFYFKRGHVSLGPGMLLEANRIYKRVGFDITHIHSIYSPLAIAIANLSRGIRGVPVVATNHSLFSWHSRAARYLVRPLLRHFLRRVDAFIAISRAVERDTRRLLGRSLRGRPVYLIPNGVDTRFWRPPEPEERLKARRELGLGERDVAVLSVGRMTRRKRIHTVPGTLAKASSLVNGGRRLALLIVGDGELRGLVEAEAARYRDSFSVVHLSGFVGRERLRSYYWAADILYIPSSLEALSLVALEASATGLPVVGWNGSGLEDVVVDGVTGFLGRSDSEAAEKIAWLASSEELRIRMGAKAAERVQRLFSWETVIRLIVNAYYETIKSAEAVDKRYLLYRAWRAIKG